MPPGLPAGERSAIRSRTFSKVSWQHVGWMLAASDAEEPAIYARRLTTSTSGITSPDRPESAGARRLPLTGRVLHFFGWHATTESACMKVITLHDPGVTAMPSGSLHQDRHRHVELVPGYCPPVTSCTALVRFQPSISSSYRGVTRQHPPRRHCYPAR